MSCQSGWSRLGPDRIGHIRVSQTQVGLGQDMSGSGRSVGLGHVGVRLGQVRSAMGRPGQERFGIIEKTVLKFEFYESLDHDKYYL